LAEILILGTRVQKSTVLAMCIGGLLMASTSAFAQDAPAAAPAVSPQAAPTDDPNEVICHKGEPILGSRFPSSRVCHTRREWNQIQKDSQDALFHQQMERSSPGGH
jgi:hypothetical protein